MRRMKRSQERSRRMVVWLVGAVVLLSGMAAGAAAPAEEDVEDAVALALKTEPGVAAQKVDVEVDEGIVTLTGSVGNMLAKERAARVTETVRGVRSTVNLLKVRASARPDAEVKADVEKALAVDPVSESWEVDVSVADGVVTLTGSVDSWRERQIAAREAKTVRGVPDVRDEIRVTYATERPDEEIETEIESALRWNPHIDDGLIVVEVDDAYVSLRGSVGSGAEKRLAETRAWTAGVTGVDASRLRVVAWARSEEFREGKYEQRSDGEIRAAVRDAMIYDPRIDAYDIEIAVNEGVVTLRGNVASLKAKRSGEQDARNTVGVWRVRNFLKVRPVREDPDDEIARSVREAIARHAMLESSDIEVSVSDGRVWLTGTVPSWVDKSMAGDVVSGISGVMSIRNELTVTGTDLPRDDPYVDLWYSTDADVHQVPGARTSLSDWELKQQIDDELWWSPYVDENNIDVSVSDGVATLSGTVETYTERASAEANAYEAGAIRVRNEITVTFGPDGLAP